MDKIEFLNRLKEDQKQRRIEQLNCSNLIYFIRISDEIRWYDRYIRYL